MAPAFPPPIRFFEYPPKSFLPMALRRPRGPSLNFSPRRQVPPSWRASPPRCCIVQQNIPLIPISWGPPTKGDWHPCDGTNQCIGVHSGAQEGNYAVVAAVVFGVSGNVSGTWYCMLTNSGIAIPPLRGFDLF